MNAQLRGKALEQICAIDGRARCLLLRAIDRFGLTMRARGRTLRVARTIADLEGKESIGVAHVAEALSYRLATDAAPGSN